MAFPVSDRHEGAHTGASASYGSATQGVLLPPLHQTSFSHPQAYMTALPTSAGSSRAPSTFGAPRSPDSATTGNPYSSQAGPPSRRSGSALSNGLAADTESGAPSEQQQEDQQPEPETPLLEQQQQQQQQPSPYYQACNYGGVLPPYDLGLSAAAQAAREAQQAALRKQVQRDIKRMLAGNKAYQHHIKGPPAISAESLAQLAQPKQRLGSRPDPQALVHIPDPVEWARWKTEQLVISRMTEERRQAELAGEKQVTDEQLVRFRQFKMEAKKAKADAKAQLAAQDAAYRASMSAYLNHKGTLDLEEFKRKKEGDRERLSLMRSRQTKGLAAHHF